MRGDEKACLTSPKIENRRRDGEVVGDSPSPPVTGLGGRGESRRRLVEFQRGRWRELRKTTRKKDTGNRKGFVGFILGVVS